MPLSEMPKVLSQRPSQGAPESDFFDAPGSRDPKISELSSESVPWGTSMPKAPLLHTVLPAGMPRRGGIQPGDDVVELLSRIQLTTY